MSTPEKRLVMAKDFLKNPSILDSYPYKYILLLDRSMDLSHQNLLAAIEQMEAQGWMLHNVTSTENACLGALMYRKR